MGGSRFHTGGCRRRPGIGPTAVARCSWPDQALVQKLAAAAARQDYELPGLSARKPLYQPWQQDKVLVRTWEQETLPPIRREAKAVGALMLNAPF